MPPNAAIGIMRREQIVAFMRGFQRENGFNPSVRQIAAGVGLSSVNSAHRHLNLLVDEGKVMRRQVSEGRFVYEAVDG